MLVVTGIGMRGAREEALLRRATAFFGTAIPVEQHRYGVFRSGAIFRWCQRIATRRLAGRLRLPPDSSAGTPPDIVAHSFGAWLVGEALRQNPDLRVGRLILIGSVLPPDFDWGSLIRQGRVEAVLNHYGLRDRWVWASEYFIPSSGPSGLRGCAPCAGVVNRAEAAFRHTTFFDEPTIDTVYRELWQPFLTLPQAALDKLGNVSAPPQWKPAPWLLKANLPRAAFVLAGLAGGVALVLGVAWVLRWLVGVLWLSS